MHVLASNDPEFVAFELERRDVSALAVLLFNGDNAVHAGHWLAVAAVVPITKLSIPNQ